MADIAWRVAHRFGLKSAGFACVAGTEAPALPSQTQKTKALIAEVRHLAARALKQDASLQKGLGELNRVLGEFDPKQPSTVRIQRDLQFQLLLAVKSLSGGSDSDTLSSIASQVTELLQEQLEWE